LFKAIENGAVRYMTYYWYVTVSIALLYFAPFQDIIPYIRRTTTEN